jgi:hypothetical protein
MRLTKAGQGYLISKDYQMKVKIHEFALKEYEDAIEWYELQLKGLGIRFKKTVLDQIEKIQKTHDISY